MSGTMGASVSGGTTRTHSAEVGGERGKYEGAQLHQDLFFLSDPI